MKYPINMKMHWFSLYLVLYLFCAKCSAMSTGELEDFSNYLEETSKLDQIHPKMNPFTPHNSDETRDEDDPVLENAWEESGKFEGDLILNDKQRKTIVDEVTLFARNGLRDSTKKWPDNEVIYYIQNEHFNSAQIQAIEDGIEDLGRASCVKFRPYKKGDRDAVVIQGSRRGCFSQVGYQGGYQVLNLSGRHPPGRGCFRHGTVVHELLHTLGFYHMQSSPDRDDYIDVAWENIVERAKHNFRKYNTFSVSDFGVGYDYESVLHYSKKAFSSNGQDTLIPKQGGASIGQRVGLSDKDTRKLNKMYCDSDSNNNEADESTNLKLPAKKAPKNVPFKGHGIGYHQGKTVVIRLPASETISPPQLPSYSSGYFSKMPSSTPSKGFGIVEEVGKKYDPWYKQGPKLNKEISIEKELPNEHRGNQIDKPFIKTNKASNNDNSNKDQKILRESIKREDLIEAFKRLEKIIKSLPPTIGLTNDLKNDNLESGEKLSKQIESISNSPQHIENNSTSAEKVKDYFNALHSEEEDGSYKTTYPFKGEYNKFEYTPQYRQILETENKYDSQYDIDKRTGKSQIPEEIGSGGRYQNFYSDEVPYENIWKEQHDLEKSSKSLNNNAALHNISNTTFSRNYNNKSDSSEEKKTDNGRQDVFRSPSSSDRYKKESLHRYPYPIKDDEAGSYENSREQDRYLNAKFNRYYSPNTEETPKEVYNIDKSNLAPNKTIGTIVQYSFSSEISEEAEREKALVKPINYEVTEKIDDVTDKTRIKPFLSSKDGNKKTDVKRSKDYEYPQFENPSIYGQSMTDDELAKTLKQYHDEYQKHYNDYDKNIPFEKIQYYSGDY